MKESIKIPAMGESISQVIIGTILKPSGSSVDVDEELLEIETEKVNQVVYAPASGVVQYTVKTGDTVAANSVIGSIEVAKKEKEAAKTAAPQEEKVSGEKKKKPVLRKGEEEFLAELTQVLQKEELPPQLAAPPPSREVSRQKMSQVRRVIAKKLVEAQKAAAILTTFNEVDMSRVMQIRKNHQEAFQKEHGVRLGLMSFFVKAVISALEKFPQVHAFIEEDEFVTPHFCDIGIAVGTEKGLFVPVLRRAEMMTFAEIEKSILQFVEKAKTGTLSPDDLQGGSFTITNGGVYGSLLSTPLLNPPQSAILGMHTIQSRPVVANEEVVIRPMMNLALSYDHRVIDGREAVLFLVHVKQMIEDPPHLLLEY